MSNKPLNTNFGDALPPRDLGSSEPWGRAIEKRIKDLERLTSSVRLAVNNQSRSASAMAARVQAQVSKDKKDEEDAKINDIEAQERAIRHETRLTEVADELDEMSQTLGSKLDDLEADLELAEGEIYDIFNDLIPGLENRLDDTSSIYYGPTTPPVPSGGHRDGDLWVAGSEGEYEIRVWDNGVWITQQIGADGINPVSIAAAVGTFLTIRTDQLTVTGSAGVNELVANEIWAKKIAARKVLANEVLIGGQVNRVPNGSGTLLDSSSGWALDSTGLSWTTGGGPAGTPGYWSTSERYTHGSSTNFVEGASFEIDAGTVSIGLWVRRTSSVASGNFVFRLLGLEGYASSPSRIEGFDNSSTANAEMWATEASLPVDTWVWCEGTFNVSEPRIVMVNIRGGAAASRYDLAGISVKSLIDHSLVVDGGILARNIATQALTVDHVITGALYQTTSLADRGIKIDSSGFKAYNNSGTQTVNITNTGNAAIAGELHSGTSTDRVSILPNVKVSGSSRPGILFQRGAISGTRQYPYVAGTDATGTSEGLFLSSGSLSDSSTASYLSLHRGGTFTLLGFRTPSSGVGDGMVTTSEGLTLYGALPATGDGSESFRVERSTDISPGGFYRVSYDPRPIGNVASFAIPRGTASALDSNPRLGSVSSASYTTVYLQRDNNTSIQAYILHAWGRDSRL